MLENLKAWAGGVVDKLEHKSAPIAPLHTTPIKAPAAEIEPPIEQSLEIPPVSHASPTPAAVVIEAIPSPQEEPSMSILSDLLKKKITFAAAAAQIEAWGAALIKSNPAVEADVTAGVSDLKQAASNMVSYADTELAAYLTPATEALEISTDTLLASLTKGATTPANPLINAGIEQAANALKAVIDAAAAKAKASLGAPAPV